ncbi:MAG: YcaO-like family protein [Desulfobacteraceae bacterium]
MEFRLKPAYKESQKNSDKIVPPGETVRIFTAKSESAGIDILEDAARIDNGRLDIPVYFSTCGPDAFSLTGTRKQMGKGVTPELAEASAVMELAERFSIYSFLDNPDNFITDTYSNIREKAIDFQLIAQSVHDRESPFSTESEQIFSDIEFRWTKAYNLSRGQEVLVPIDWFFMINEFNGTSAGNCNEEAVCQGACELVERHVCDIVSKKMPSLPRIDPCSAQSGETRGLIRKFSDSGIEFVIHDFTLGMGVPTVGVLAWDPATFPEESEVVWTAGTAPSPDKALSRALTEVAQLAGDFNTASSYVASGLPKFESIEQAEKFAEKSSGPVDLSTLPDISSNNIKDEVDGIIRALDTKGMELLVIRTTDPRLDIPAFYCIIPGTRFRERAENSSVAMFSARYIFENYPPEKAYETLGKMAGMIPGQYYVEFFQGLCRLSTQEHEEALSHLEKAMSLEPSAQDIPSICSYTGVCLKEAGEYERALQVLSKGLEADSERTDIHNLMGFCNFMLKRHEESIRCFKEVIRLDPGSAIDHASIGSNYRELGDVEKAKQYYEIALAIDPGLDFARENLEKLAKKDYS